MLNLPHPGPRNSIPSDSGERVERSSTDPRGMEHADPNCQPAWGWCGHCGPHLGGTSTSLVEVRPGTVGTALGMPASMVKMIGMVMDKRDKEASWVGVVW